jgi:hypothetical protein
VKTKKPKSVVKVRTVTWEQKEPLIRHLERAGTLTINELATLQSMNRGMELLREAYVSWTGAIGDAHNLPAGRAWRIMPGGEIGLEDK